MGIAEETMGFPGLMPTEMVAGGFPGQVKLLIVLELVLKNPHS